MTNRAILSLASVCLLSACATATRFNDAMEGAVKTTKSAGDVIDAAEKDLIRAHAIGAVEYTLGVGVTLEDLTCRPRPGVSATAESLKVFSDATDLVAKVAKKPDDTTYAGYIAKLKADREAAKAPQGAEEAMQLKAKEAEAAVRRCSETFQADTSAEPKLGPAKSVGTTDANALAIIGALDKVFKTLLSAIEAAERDAAVKATVEAVIPPMEEARDRLKKKYDGGDYGPVVRFNAAPAEIVEMNRTVLGGAITLERWYVARKINVLWVRLETSCRSDKAKKAKTEGMDCLADHAVRADVDALVEAIYAYRGLAPLDSKKILEKLDKSIVDAKNSKAVKTADLLEGIATVAGSLSDISDAWEKYKKAKE
ncbi:hypothetical protein [Roseateles amylovorans]|uniref:Lipoprotein n=1 Tax=Roseateles amylovorans TaxID=2978473 RepID=A0ABY6B5H7_9BURK|nr:hypothetical protein [Roseateles amylovorans]UXH80102.1 hypothetical protein N4261_09555 [Roseateles amylovorans]